MSGRAPNEYKDVPIFTEYHTSSGSEEEDPMDKQICRSLISLSTAVQMISATPGPATIENTFPTMSIATAIPRYNLILLLEEQACQEEDCLKEAEEAHQEEEQEEEAPTNLSLRQTENLWACYQQSLKEIAQKLRASSESSPPTS